PARVLENFGTLNMQAGVTTVNGIFLNHAGAVMNVNATSNLSWVAIDPGTTTNSNAVTNEGTINKSSTGMFTFSREFINGGGGAFAPLSFSNDATGTVNVQQGVVSLDVNSMSNAGDIEISAGSTVGLTTGPITLAGTSTLHIELASAAQASALNLHGATLAG